MQKRKVQKPPKNSDSRSALEVRLAIKVIKQANELKEILKKD